MGQLMIENIRRRVESGEYRFTVHAFERCVERNISTKEIKDVILFDEVIEDYQQDKYGPRELLKRIEYYMGSVQMILSGLLWPLIIKHIVSIRHRPT